MSEASARRAASELFPELLQGLRQLEGRFPPKEIAARIVNAAMAQPEVAGARLWRIDKGVSAVWAQAGSPPPVTDGEAAAGPLRDGAADPTLWTGALGSDDFRIRVLEAHAVAPLTDVARTQLDFLARFAAVVLALAERRGAMDELSCIVEATKRLNSTLDLGELIHIILQIATRQTGAERGTVFLMDRERGEMWSLVGLGLEQQVIRFAAGRGIAGWIAREGTAVRLENAYDDARFEPEFDRRLGFTTRRVMGLPIRNESGAIVGVLELLNKAEAFTAEDEAFLDALSVHVALALEKAQLHRARIEKEKMERDLVLAREIQAGFLPEAPPIWKGIEICVSHRASQMVGGDYYDFLPVQSRGKEALLVVVADVEGKGTASALVMANVQATLHALADHAEPLDKLPATINQKILEGARGSQAAGRNTKYITMFMAFVEDEGRALRYVNAGHVQPVVIRADGSHEFLETGGMVVGLLPDACYECGTVAMGKGDLLIACTDGITEAMDADGNEYGPERLADSVTKCRTQKPEEILRCILDEVDLHSRGGVHEDDRILMVLRVT
jgi:sigma-B regulation protein RsbU (phosphoserine phosphatase)